MPMRQDRWFDRLIPARCLLCGAATRGVRDLCAPCAGDLPWLGAGCPRCALPLAGPAGTGCGACLRHPPRFSACVAAFAYAWPVRELILRFKQGGDLAAGRLLAGLLAHTVGAGPQPVPRGAVLVPMPLHPRRLAVRGFNQAERIAVELARGTGLALHRTLAVRRMQTRDQKQLGAAERRANLAQAFAAAPCRGLQAIIVDDVLTTGASADALAAALMAAGAADVRVWCLARAL
jgi:ComF family protein